jgi:hypothetical protein
MRATAAWLAVIGLACAVTLVTGCQPVRQDRTITWSKDGGAAGFQQDRGGVFVTDKPGARPVKIFDPGPDVVAVSTPLWNPRDPRLIFTTARLLGDTPRPRNRVAREPNPAGNVFGQQAISYTCWLRGEPKDGQAPAPVALFEAACDHVGYVAAGLVVRWHPHGDRVLYVGRDGAYQHSLFEFDLTTGASRRLFPHAADALVFDPTPDGNRLVCVLGGTRHAPTDGIWVRELDDGPWWHVPDSHAPAWAALPSVIERLRATLPVWSADGGRFAFASLVPKADDKQANHHVLRVGSTATHQTRVLAEGSEPFRDLSWAPDGHALGCIRAETTGPLVRINLKGKSAPLDRRPVRRFAGWSRSGAALAYVAPDPRHDTSGSSWALLLLPDPEARDAVLLAPGDGKGPAREVFSGMRVTFPNWSTHEDKLSLWVTFGPTHRFYPAWLVGGTLHPGDPAAVLDAKTGNLTWLAVSPEEKAQVGHYQLSKKDYAAAWRSYEEVEREAPKPKPPTLEQFGGEFNGPLNITFFQSYCLKKLGRAAESRRKLAVFRRTYLPPPAATAPGRQPAPADKAPQQRAAGNRSNEWWLRGGGLGRALLQDMYAAEAFLSVDAAGDAERYFREAPAEATNDESRLSSALALAQVYLLRGKDAAYAVLTTDTVLPLLLRQWTNRPLDTGHPLLNEPLLFVGALALAPLDSPAFLAGLPEAHVQALVRRWSLLRGKARDDVGRLAVDLVLHTAYGRLGHHKEPQTVARRIEANPAGRTLLPEEGFADVGEALRHGLTGVRTQLAAWRDLVGDAP